MWACALSAQAHRGVAHSVRDRTEFESAQTAHTTARNFPGVNYSTQFSNRRAAQPARQNPRKLSRDTVSLVGDLLPLCDFTGVLLAAYLATLVYAGWGSAGAATSALWDGVGRAALAAAVLAPFILCERAFVAFASSGQSAALIRCFAVRFLMFAAIVSVIGLTSSSLQSLPQAWLVLWFLSSLLVTAMVRWLLVRNLRRLERSGVLAETIAVVGAGPVADRLIRHLMQTRRDSIEILGVFDDRANRSDGCVHKPAGSINDLIELGQSQSIDWILLTLPASGESQLQSLVHRLKSLAVPVGLCPQNVGLAAPGQAVRYVGDGLPVTRLTDRPATPWDAAVAVLETVLPRWIMTLLGLPLIAVRLLRALLAEARQPRAQKAKLDFSLDNYDLEGFTKVAARFGQKRFGYVVTPNADHLIRLHHEPSFRALYADAAYVLLDSRFISQLLHFTQKLSLPVCTGSDLTAKLFSEVITPDDRLVLIGGSDEQAARLRQRYGLKQLAHFNPPMGFIRDPAAVEACLQFIEAHSPFRYCLLAVGAPQQETLAQLLKMRGAARGMALCIGASINFLTGDEQRAPLWMQRSGMEWLFRLTQAPGRMAQRYLVRGPQLFGLLRNTRIVLRAAKEPAQVPAIHPVAIRRLRAMASLSKRFLAPRAVRRATSVAAWRAIRLNEAAPMT